MTQTGIYCPIELTRQQAESRCRSVPCELFRIDHIHRVAEDDDNNRWIGTLITCYNPDCGGLHPGLLRSTTPAELGATVDPNLMLTPGDGEEA